MSCPPFGTSERCRDDNKNGRRWEKCFHWSSSTEKLHLPVSVKVLWHPSPVRDQAVCYVFFTSIGYIISHINPRKWLSHFKARNGQLCPLCEIKTTIRIYTSKWSLNLILFFFIHFVILAAFTASSICCIKISFNSVFSSLLICSTAASNLLSNLSFSDKYRII